MKFNRWPVMAALLITQTQFASAQDQGEELQRLKQQLRELEQKVRVLEHKQELEAEAAEMKRKESPSLVLGANGFTLQSADTNFALTFHGVVQTDNRTFFGDHGISGNDGFLLRKARPILQGTLLKDFDFLFVPEFGGSSVQILDANLNYRYAPWLQLKVGKFKTPISLEQLQGDANTLFNERSLVSDLVPNRDVGFQLWGDLGGGTLTYAVGVFNGVGDARNSGNADFEDHREFAGRVFAQPFKESKATALRGLGLGLGGSFGNTFSNATGLPNNNGFLTDGQQLFFAYTNGVVADGDHWRLAPQGYYYFGPFGLLGEYVISNQRVSRGATSANLEQTAWQVAASWMLTGEEATYGGVTPKHPFDLSRGHWGAWQLAARYAELDVDDKAFPTFADPRSSASGARSWAVGLNWYLNKNIRLMTSYSHTDFEGGGKSTASAASGAVTHQDEDVWFTRFQLLF